MASRRAMKLAGRRVADAIDRSRPVTDAATLDARVEALRAVRAERRVRAGRARRRGAALGLLAACFAVFAFLLLRPRSLSFTVDGSKGEIGRFVASPIDGSSTLRFSDGTRIELHEAGRARVSSVDDRGAFIVLEDGTLTASVIHKPRAAWTIAAGPFEIHVIGTTFDASWSSSDETLTVDMDEGRVEVTGSCIDSPRPITSHESMRFSCRGVAVTAPVASSSSSALEAAAPAPPASGAEVSSAPRMDPPPTAVSEPSWRELFKRGDFRAAYARADRDGELGRAALGSSSDLRDLAELARLAGHPETARGLYLALRDRRPGSEEAALAAFQLGRMSGGASSEAERWFSLYLAERPNGALAAEALGRILEIEHRAGRSSAPSTAKRYLERFPNGAHAALARSIVGP